MRISLLENGVDLFSNDIFSIWHKEIALSSPPLCSNLYEGLISQKVSGSQQWLPRWGPRPSKTSAVNPLCTKAALKYAHSNAQVMKRI